MTSRFLPDGRINASGVEIAQGAHWLGELLRLLPGGTRTVALGGPAADACRRAGLVKEREYRVGRHPSTGGIIARTSGMPGPVEGWKAHNEAQIVRALGGL